MPISDDGPREIAALARSGYLPALEQWAKRATAPIWWRDDSAGASGFMGGTMCFVDTGTRLLGITAQHVHEDIVAKRRVNPRLKCQVGGHTFEPESRLIQADHELDLATYDFSEVTANAVGVDVHFAPAWPPIVLDGDVGIVGGWPWSLSSAEIGTVAHQFLHFAVRLQVHSADGIGAAVFTSTSIPWGENALPLGTNLGGMSGGPVFRLVAEPIEHLRLVGIVYEYHTEFELILARPLTLVASDGSIGRREHDV